jgi:polyisoprenoid-binding protein YceI
MFRSKHTGLKSLIAIVLVVFFSNTSFSKEFKLDNHKSSFSIFGTSSLHDWEEKAMDQNGKMSLNSSEGLQIQNLYIEILAESLKSGKNIMDKNTYKALKTDKFKTITFQYVKTLEASLLQEGTYKLKILGDLTIAGFTNSIQLNLKLYLKGNEVNVLGEKEILMTDYNVDPPKALLGTIKTGNEITIKFNTVMLK